MIQIQKAAVQQDEEEQEDNQSTVDNKPFGSILGEVVEIERNNSMGMSDLDIGEVEDKSSASMVDGSSYHGVSKGSKCWHHGKGG